MSVKSRVRSSSGSRARFDEPVLSTPSSAPESLTSFVGRRREVAEVRRLIGGNRLVTLTGSGGCGKSRLALKASTALPPGVAGRAWRAELASVSDGDLVPQAVAETVGLKEEAGLSFSDSLVARLAAEQALLVLDDCEHLVGACATLAERLLTSCPRLRILATSREPLRLPGEIAWRVPSLSRRDATKLFVDRARIASRRLSISENDATVALICERLDGMPLAIELAAAQVRLMSVPEVLSRLDDRFQLLVGGSRTALRRHQTLEATLNWSYRLLDNLEQKLFRRLAVFVGGFSIASAEDICSADDLASSEVFRLVVSLIDKSLLVTEERRAGRTRYRQLESVRQYAERKLQAEGEAAGLRRHHLDHYLALAEEAESRLDRPEQLEWLDRLHSEMGNLRAALSWGRQSDRVKALALASALSRYWSLRGLFTEGRERLKDAMEGAPVSARLRARALMAIGELAWSQGDAAAARTALEEARELFGRLRDGTGMARADCHLGIAALLTQDYVPAQKAFGESLAAARRLGLETVVARALWGLGQGSWRQGDLQSARPPLEESLAICRSRGDREGISWALDSLGHLMHSERQYAEARVCFESTLELGRQLDSSWMMAHALNNLGDLALDEGDRASAAAFYEAGLELARRIGRTRAVVGCLKGLARLAAVRSTPARTLRLAAAAQALEKSIGVAMSGAGSRGDERWLAQAWLSAGRKLAQAAWAEGSAMTLEEAIAYALGESGSRTSGPLSARERQVAGLVARGAANREIATRLGIAERTAENHVEHILTKLGFHSRAQIAAWVTQRRLLIDDQEQPVSATE